MANLTAKLKVPSHIMELIVRIQNNLDQILSKYPSQNGSTAEDESRTACQAQSGSTVETSSRRKKRKKWIDRHLEILLEIQKRNGGYLTYNDVRDVVKYPHALKLAHILCQSSEIKLTKGARAFLRWLNRKKKVSIQRKKR